MPPMPVDSHSTGFFLYSFNHHGRANSNSKTATNSTDSTDFTDLKNVVRGPLQTSLAPNAY